MTPILSHHLPPNHYPPSVVTTLPQIPSRGNAPFVNIGRRGSPMALSARPVQYIVSGPPTPSRATTGHRPLTTRTTTQVRLFKQLLDKRTGALLGLPQISRIMNRTFLKKPDNKAEHPRCPLTTWYLRWYYLRWKYHRKYHHIYQKKRGQRKVQFYAIQQGSSAYRSSSPFL